MEKTLEFIEELGLEYAELVHQFPSENIDVNVLESYDLKYSIHAPFMDINIAALQDKSREAVVVHPGLAPFLANKYFLDKVYQYSNESIKELGEYSDEIGVLTTIENMPTFDGMLYQNLADLNDLLVSLDMSMTLDIGHANHASYPPEAMYFDSIKHIHAHDNFGDDDAHLALGEGSIELNTIINNFEKNKFDGIYIIEVNDYDSIKKSFEYMKENFKI